MKKNFKIHVKPQNLEQIIKYIFFKSHIMCNKTLNYN